ncbi:Crp/Fnr family transcriptional regulator [Thermospira aquatica]|uniref:Cyclic nucleotide-binding domain-containing protein n=1 Tax=Thermospira aquatica TaxID=2828656 RepID=A0AAX3BB95_9SPIR|nr:cyclic nucleotide-binding domain-containing protein [Thermospira aquatica]URA09361.1 cyclic nucleotide-binding domain-containing protein [Thermospira aquatica]
MQEKESFLGKITLFSELTEEERKQVGDILHYRHYKKGEVIVSEGDEGTSLFLFQKGVVQVTSQITLKRTGDDKWMEAEKSIATYDEVKMPFFGEMSLLTGAPRSATVKAMTDVELYEVFQKDFYDLCERNHTIGYKLLKAIAQVLCGRIRSLNQNILKLTTALSIVVSKKR